MQQDDIIWNIIGEDFCAFRVKTADKHQTFCKNENNLTGLCNRASCPLANSQYATVRDIEGECSLFVKTIERAHMPSQLWEQIKLNPYDHAKALQQVSCA